MKFRVLIEPDEDGVFVAECPVLPGCISQGKTRAEAVANIQDAIQGFFTVWKNTTNPFPDPARKKSLKSPYEPPSRLFRRRRGQSFLETWLRGGSITKKTFPLPTEHRCFVEPHHQNTPQALFRRDIIICGAMPRTSAIRSSTNCKSARLIPCLIIRDQRELRVS